jgi:hypothetical protein
MVALGFDGSSSLHDVAEKPKNTNAVARVMYVVFIFYCLMSLSK